MSGELVVDSGLGSTYHLDPSRLKVGLCSIHPTCYVIISYRVQCARRTYHGWLIASLGVERAPARQTRDVTRFYA